MTAPELRDTDRASAPARLRASLLDAADTRIIDAVFMGLFMVVLLIPGTTLGFHTAATAAIAALASFRRPTRSLVGAEWYVGICAAILLYLGLSAFLSGVTTADVNRFIRIALLMTVAGFIASGRIDIRSGLRGIAVVLVMNVPLFYAGIAPDNYQGVLTGLLGDKNVAGLTYAIFAVLLLILTKSAPAQALVLLGGGACVFLTDSRTSMAALAAGVIWLAVARYLNPVMKLGLAGAIYVAFEFAEVNFAQAGSYVNREGSDALRERIDAASLEKVVVAPWFGSGLGEAQVEVAGNIWFFHNAYWALLVEGGYPLLIGVLALVSFAGLQLFAKGRSTRESRVVQAATVVLLLCSFRLGETFFSIPAFLLLGIGVMAHVKREADWLAARSEKWSTGLIALSHERRPGDRPRE